MSYGKLQPGKYFVLPVDEIEDLLSEYTSPSPIGSWEIVNPNGLGQIFIMEYDDHFSLVTSPLHDVTAIESNGRLAVISESLLAETYLDDEFEDAMSFTLRQSMSVEEGDDPGTILIGLYEFTTTDELEHCSGITSVSNTDGYDYEDDDEFFEITDDDGFSLYED